MGYAAPQPSEMFSDAQTGTEVLERFEAYKGAMSQVHQTYGQGGYVLTPERGLVKNHGGAPGALDTLTKSLTPEQVASLRGELASLQGVTADVAKDWSIPAAANNTNLVPYDLESPAKLLVPRNTPLRNSIPRTKGQGLAVEYRRVMGWTNSSTGVADRLPFIDSQTDVGLPTFGTLALRRGPKISYASTPHTVSYVEMGLSDQVNWKAQYASQGFQDIRALSHTALLWAHMLGEEKALLYSRGASAKGYAGALAAPTATVASSSTGGTVAAGTYYVKVTASSGGGESAPSTVVNTGALTGSTNKFTITVTVPSPGAANYNVYIGTASGSETYVTSIPATATPSLDILATPVTGGAAVPVADSSVQANGYDGFLTVLLDPTKSGYVGTSHANKVFDASNHANSIGDDPWQKAFVQLYGANAGPGGIKRQADPDEIWVDGNIRRALGDFVKYSGNANGYRISLTQGEAHGGVTIGSVASGIQNQVTGKMLDLNVHPFMPNGCSIIRSRTLPVPDSEISNTTEVRCVQDYLAVDWPEIQMTWDSSTYMFGTVVHYAPEWSGALSGLS